MGRMSSRSLRRRFSFLGRPSKQRPFRKANDPGLLLESLEPRTLLTAWADLAGVINSNLPAVRGLIPGIADGTFRAQIPLVQSSLSQTFDPSTKLLAAFPIADVFSNPDLSIDQACTQLTSDYHVEYCALTPEAGSNDLLRLTKSLTLPATPVPINLGGIGGSIGFPYFDTHVNGALSGSMTPTVQPVTVSVTLGVDLVGANLQFYVADGSGLREPGIGGTARITGDMNIGHLLNVHIVGDDRLDLVADLNWHRADGQKLRLADLSNQANVRGGFSGTVNFGNVSLKTQLPILPDLMWSGSWGATVISSRVSTSGPNLTAPDTLPFLRGIAGGLFTIKNNFQFLNPIADALNTKIPIFNTTLGDQFDVTGALGWLLRTITPNLDQDFAAIKDYLNNTFHIYIGIPPGGNAADQPKNLSELGDLLAHAISGEHVDLLSFWQQGRGRPWSYNQCITFADWGLPVLLDAHVDACFGGYIGWDYSVGIGIDTTGFYIDPRTHIGVEGGLSAGLRGGLRVAGFDFATASGSIHLDAHGSLTLRNPDPSQGDRIYLDQIYDPNKGLLRSFLDDIQANLTVDLSAHVDASIRFHLLFFNVTVTVFSHDWNLGRLIDIHQPLGTTTTKRPRQLNLIDSGLNIQPVNGVLTLDGSGNQLDDDLVALTQSAGDGGVDVNWLGRGKAHYTGLTQINFVGGPHNNRLQVTPGFRVPINARAGGQSDYLEGGDDGCTLTGGAGQDTLVGGNGANRLTAGSGNTLLIAGNGPSTLSGGAGDDTLYGGTGNDMLNGGLGNAVLYAGGGNSTLIGGTGNATLYGGFGNDLLIGGLRESATDSGSTGNDLIVADTVAAGNGRSTIWGSGGADTLIGGARQSEIHGGNGINRMRDFNGDPLPDGNLLIAGVLTDPIKEYVEGGGNDTVWAGNGFNTIVAGGGNDRVLGCPADFMDSNGNILRNGCTAVDTFRGGTGNNTVYGGTGHDLLIAGSGNDLIQAGPGGATLVAGKGQDTLNGGDGDDTLQLTFAANSGPIVHHLSGGNGRDTLAIVTDENNHFVKLTQDQTDRFHFTAHSYTTGDMTTEQRSFSFEMPGDVEVLALQALAPKDSNGNPIRLDNELVVDPSCLRDTELIGGFGNDTLIGGGGNTTLWAGTGNDLLRGGLGDNEFHGGQGDSTLIGNGDVFYGGMGNNTMWAGSNNAVMNGGNSLPGGPRHQDVMHVLPGTTSVEMDGGRNVLNPNGTVKFYGNDAIMYAGRGNTVNSGDGNNVIYSDGNNRINAAYGTNTIYASTNTDTVIASDQSDNTLFMFTVPAGDANILLSATGDGNGNYYPTVTVNGASQQFLHFHQVRRFGIQGDSGTQNITVDFHVPNNGNQDLFDDGVIVRAGSGNDRIVLNALPMPVTVTGGSGNDTILGGSAVGTLIYGGTGDSTYELDGTAGSDTLQVQTAAYQGQNPLTVRLNGQVLERFSQLTVRHLRINGMAGDDQITLGPLGGYYFPDLTVTAGPGNVLMDARAVTSQGVTLRAGDGNNTLYGGSGNDLLVTDTGNSLLVAGPGNATLQAGAGNDTLYGGPGNDFLYGGRGNNVLYAGTGHNYLSGGPGNNLLYYNGDGSVYDAGTGVDDRLVIPPPPVGSILVVYGLGWYDNAAHAWHRLPVGSRFNAYDLQTNGNAGSTLRYGTPQEDTQGLGFFQGRLYVDGRPVYSVTEFALTGSTQDDQSIITGPDGNLWQTDYLDNKIRRLTPAGNITEFSIPTANSQPFGITKGPDGNLWFGEYNGNKIGVMTTAGVVRAEYPIPTSGSGINWITAGPGDSLWFVEEHGNNVGRITLNGVITEFSIPTLASSPETITLGRDGNFWFTEFQQSGKIGRITPLGTITEFTIPTANSAPATIVAGPDGNIWFAEQHGHRIGRVNLTHEPINITEFSTPTAGSSPSGITAGPDGNLWFTEENGNKVGRITPSGTITEFPVPTAGSVPYQITAGPDNNLWFTEYQGKKIGRLTLPLAASFHIAAPASVTAGSPFSVTVTAVDAYGNTAYGYRGTIHFTGTADQNLLPADYTFTAADQGVHTFTLTLRTAGGQSLTVTDTMFPTLKGTSAVANVSAFSYPDPAGQQGNYIITGPDGNLWWTDPSNNEVWRMSPQGTNPTSFQITGGPNGITVGPDRNLWITVTTANQILKMSVIGEMLGRLNISIPNSAPRGITVDPDDNTIWFAQPDGHVLGQIMPNGMISETSPLTDGTGRVVRPDDLVTGYDGNIWFTAPLDKNGNAYNQIGIYNPVTKTVSRWLPLPAGYTEPTPIIRGPDQTMWFTADRSDHLAIGRVAPNGALTMFDISNLPAVGGGITTGPDGNLWFTAAGMLGRISPLGDVQLFPLSGGLTSPHLITFGPDNNLWFTANGAVGRFNPAVAVVAAAPTVVRLTSSASTVVAGNTFTITLTAYDAYGNVATGYRGTVHVTSSDGQARLPADYPFTAADNGSHTFMVTLQTAASQTVTLSDTQNTGLSGTVTMAVIPAVTDHFRLTAAGTIGAGMAFNVTVTALDPFNNVTSAYHGTVRFTSTDPQAVLPGDYGFTAVDAGVHTFSVTLKTAGTQSVTATDTVAGSLTGSQTGILVTPAAASTFSLVGFPGVSVAGMPGMFTVTALDPYRNVATGYRGTATFRSDDPNAMLPADYSFTAADAGVHAFTATLTTAGSHFLRVADTQTGTLTGEQDGIVVNPGPADHFRIAAPARATAGTAFEMTVTAADHYNNTTPNYRGTIHVTVPGDPQFIPPADYSFTAADNGVHTFALPSGITLRTFGAQTVVVSDGTFQSSALVNVDPAAASRLTVTGFPATITAGMPGIVTVIARDAYGNPTPNYLGTIHWTSTDSQALLPEDYTFKPDDLGSRTFFVILDTAGAQFLTATDTVSGTITGTQSGIVVTPAPADHFQIHAHARVSPNTPFSVTATALDPYGNIDVNYAGTVRFTTTDLDPNVVLPADYTFTVADGGVHTFLGGFSLVTLGHQLITATDMGSGITGSATVKVRRANTPLTGNAGRGSGHAGLGTEASLVATAGRVKSQIQMDQSLLLAEAIDCLFGGNDKDEWREWFSADGPTANRSQRR